MSRTSLGVAFRSREGVLSRKRIMTISPPPFAEAQGLRSHRPRLRPPLLFIPRLSSDFDKGKIHITFQMLQTGKSWSSSLTSNELTERTVRNRYAPPCRPRRKKNAISALSSSAFLRAFSGIRSLRRRGRYLPVQATFDNEALASRMLYVFNRPDPSMLPYMRLCAYF
jgi:hypothetical protein